MRRIILLLLFLTRLFAEEYELGEGIKVPHLPLYIGGYATVDYLQRADDYHRFRVDDLALLGYGNVDRLSYMAEIEIKEGYVKEWGKIDRERTSHRVSIERLYADYALSDTFSVRMGKFNTPVGYWNLEPVNVLRDSASNPYLAFIVYPRFTTGIQLTHTNALYSDTDYSLTLQENDDLDDHFNNISVDRHYGGGVEHFLGDDLRIKANIGYFRTTDDEDFYYGVAAIEYEQPDYKISAEYGARRSEREWIVPYAFYAQGVWHLKKRHDLIGRFEHYKIDEGAMRDEQIGVIGYTYRPVYPVAIKAEYQAHSYTNENQFHLAFSIMF